METNDHDILIEVKTILKAVVEDFRSFRRDTHEEIARLIVKVADIEKNKLSIVDFNEHDKNENDRLSRLEKAYWVAIGVTLVIQLLIPIIVKRF